MDITSRPHRLPTACGRSAPGVTVPRALAVLVATWASTFAGCGASPASASSTFQPSLSHSTYLMLSLPDGAVTTSVDDPGLGSAGILVLRHLGDHFLGVTEVTKGQWLAVMGTRPWSTVPASAFPEASQDDPLQPACAISQEQAQSFAARLAGATGLPISLPALATYQDVLAGAMFPWGNAADLATVARFASVRETAATAGILHEAGASEATDGFYDLIGNVREWTAEGGAFGGSSLDNLAVIQASPVVMTVSAAIAHPLDGLRVSCPADQP
jgi:formylglycine-generating enzyme required for sulfatase activity